MRRAGRVSVVSMGSRVKNFLVPKTPNIAVKEESASELNFENLAGSCLLPTLDLWLNEVGGNLAELFRVGIVLK